MDSVIIKGRAYSIAETKRSTCYMDCDLYPECSDEKDDTWKCILPNHMVYKDIKWTREKKIMKIFNCDI